MKATGTCWIDHKILAVGRVVENWVYITSICKMLFQRLPMPRPGHHLRRDMQN